LLKQHGYTVEVDIIIEGKCVKHEIDVFASNDREVLLVECKYRNRAENPPDVKIAMYVHARFQDLKPVVEPRYSGKNFSGLLVTNTRFTSDAIQFAQCAGVTIKSWGYPENNSLEKMIEGEKLYPVTVMSSLTSAQIKRLIDKHVILMKDLARMKEQDIQRLLSISNARAIALKNRADELCFCD